MNKEEEGAKDIYNVGLVSFMFKILNKQASLSLEFSRQEYWNGQPFPSPGDLPHPGMEHKSPALQVDSLPFEPPGKPNTCANT